jgi:hypothetical protein
MSDRAAQRLRVLQIEIDGTERGQIEAFATRQQLIDVQASLASAPVHRRRPRRNGARPTRSSERAMTMASGAQVRAKRANGQCVREGKIAAKPNESGSDWGSSMSSIKRV